ncbi:alpha/beta fold hydrolase [Muricauda sp. JGD-17]|uniref:Alpha/beta fold hydrolase n=1 Tax=Flagellimonas ochracea TaxID=2696472 RepID=A0A964TC86_9FLAO|nr:alpha/beta hydrolase [Allomuricauda ochracea]NAY92190.1 alpha/beta fold hydrolase [Allomuricauda ochracea]
MKKAIFLIGLSICLSKIGFGQKGSAEPFGQLVDIGGYNLHFNILGDSETTIVIEGGTGSWTIQWLELQRRLSEEFKVVTYDRAGYGWSDSSPYSRTAFNMVDELNTGLEKLGISSPFILIGHSYGGMIIRAFAKKFPEKVKALILVDSASEYQFEQLPPMIFSILEVGKKQFKQSGAMARVGQLKSHHIPIDSTLDKKYWRAYQYNTAKPYYYDAMYNEMDLLPMTYEQSEIKTPIDIPLLVISAGDSFEAFAKVPNLPKKESNEVWNILQKKLLDISTNSLHHIIEKGSHDLLLTSPTELERTIKKYISSLD